MSEVRTSLLAPPGAVWPLIIGFIVSVHGSNAGASEGGAVSSRNAVRVGVGSDVLYDGKVWAVSYERLIAGAPATKPWPALLVDATVSYLPDGQSVLGPCPCVVKRAESMNATLGIRGRSARGSLSFDVTLGGLISYVDWTEEFEGRSEDSVHGWFGGYSAGIGIGIAVTSNFILRFDGDMFYVSSSNDKHGDPLAFLPWRLGVAYHF